jgi:hypothetical protein
MLIQHLETGSYLHKIYWVDIFRKDLLSMRVKIVDTQIHVHIVTCRVMHVTKITGSSSDDWIY